MKMASSNKFENSRKAEIKSQKDILQEELEIPTGISAVVENDEITLKKDNKEVKRKLNNRIEVKIQGNKILLTSKKSSKREKKLFYTIKAHIKNAFEGLTKEFKYKLKAVSVHFPMTLELDKANNILLVKNFLGEKKPRQIKIIPGVEVKIDKDSIELECADIEKAGQVAANIEKGTKIRCRDRRVFQDGIFITEKPGVIYS
jgi:large subunit ribosomal protein L6